MACLNSRLCLAFCNDERVFFLHLDWLEGACICPPSFFFFSFLISFVYFSFSSTSPYPFQDIIPRLAWNIQQHEGLAHFILLAILSERLSWKLA